MLNERSLPFTVESMTSAYIANATSVSFTSLMDQNESFHILRTCLWLNKRLWMPLLTRTRTISSSSSFAFWPSKFWTLMPKQKRTCQGDWPVEAVWRRALVKIEVMNNCEKANDHNDLKVLCFWSHKNKPIKAICQFKFCASIAQFLVSFGVALSSIQYYPWILPMH